MWKYSTKAQETYKRCGNILQKKFVVYPINKIT